MVGSLGCVGAGAVAGRVQQLEQPSSSTTTTTKGVPGCVPSNVPNQGSARKDVQMINCGSSSGGWSAGGTIKNMLGHHATYHITVFFTSTEATDLAYGSTSVPVTSGQTKRWSVKSNFSAPAQVLCVLRGVAAN
jgi:hypothetical protein